MSKILLITLDFPPRTGGVARYLEALADFFKAEISVIAVPEAGSETFDQGVSYKIKRQELLSRFFWPRWFKTVGILFQERKNYQTLIVSHLLPLGAAAWLAKFFTGKPYIVIVHGMDVALVKPLPVKKCLSGLILRGAKVVVTNSAALAEEVKKDFGVKQTEVVYPGVRNFNYHIDADRHLHDNNRFNLLTVSRLVPRKGHLRTLEVVAKLKDQIPNLNYTIVGEGSMKDELQKKIEELQLASIVKIVGRVIDVELNEIYRQADVFVMPTVGGQADREGFGTVYLEAATFGVPSVASNLPGVDEAVLNEVTGLLIVDGDIGALREAILCLWHELETRQRLGLAAKNRAVSEFTWEKQIVKFKKYV